MELKNSLNNRHMGMAMEMISFQPGSNTNFIILIVYCCECYQLIVLSLSIPPRWIASNKPTTFLFFSIQRQFVWYLFRKCLENNFLISDSTKRNRIYSHQISVQ